MIVKIDEIVALLIVIGLLVFMFLHPTHSVCVSYAISKSLGHIFNKQRISQNIKNIKKEQIQPASR